MWGGLRPIRSRLLLDVATIVTQVLCALTAPTLTSVVILIFSSLCTVATAGLTQRWTITFPMVPFLFLQGMRRIDVLLDGKYGRLVSDVVLVTSILLSALSTVLTILFPAVEFHPISGRFQVGIIDVQLPVDFSEGLRRGSMVGTAHEHEEELLDSGSVTARILYPTNDKGGSIPYFDPRSANVICQEMMKAGAPGPLKKFSWMLHTWQLTKLRAIRNACPAEVEEDSRTKKLPIVIWIKRA